MPEFTKGKWDFIEWPVSSDKEEKQKYLIGSPERAIGFIFHKADARLIVAVPEMYKLLKDFINSDAETDSAEYQLLQTVAAEVLNNINGKDTGHDEQPPKQR